VPAPLSRDKRSIVSHLAVKLLDAGGGYGASAGLILPDPQRDHYSMASVRRLHLGAWGNHRMVLADARLDDGCERVRTNAKLEVLFGAGED